MPIKTRLTITGNAISDEIAALDAIDAMMMEAAQKAKQIVEPQWLSEAQYYPPPAKLPFQFATEKSRNFYFWKFVKGRGPGRYVRTGKLKESFFFRLIQNDHAVTFLLGSDSTVAKWVVDSFDKRRRYQVPGHRKTGWLPIADTANFWLEVAEEEFMKQVTIMYGQYYARRSNR